MELNYIAFFLISFLPLIIARFWYRHNSKLLNWAGIPHLPALSWGQLIWAFFLSFTLIYGYINIVIHQMGFYELFFTDIMKGSAEAQIIVDEFLAKYGDKHRHFGHGVFHGAINAFVFALPFIGVQALLSGKDWKFVTGHFGYWLLTSILVGGLISEFV